MYKHLIPALALLAAAAAPALAADPQPQTPPDPRVVNATIGSLEADLRLREVQMQAMREEVQARVKELREKCGAPCAAPAPQAKAEPAQSPAPPAPAPAQ